MVGNASDDFVSGYPCGEGFLPTHTSIPGDGFRGGKYYVSEPKYADFLASYVRCLENGGAPTLTERPGAFFPLIADIDLRYDATPAERSGESAPVRRHGDGFVRDACEALGRAYASMCRQSAPSRCFVARVAQRSAPYVKGGEVRDGVHVMFPDVVLARPAHSALRSRALASIGTALASLEGQLLSPDRSFDAVYAEGGNWQMYGSRKPGRDAYELTHTVNVIVTDEFVSSSIVPVPDPRDWRKWVPALSVRTSGETKVEDLSDEARAEVDAVEDARAEAAMRSILAREEDDDPVFGEPRVRESRSSREPADVVEHVRRCLWLLDPARAEPYDQWRNVGFALRNTSDELLDDWHRWSARSDKYDRKTCQRLWDAVRARGAGESVITWRSIEFWARADDPDAFEEIAREQVDRFLDAAILGNTNTDWGTYLIARYPDRMVGVPRGDRSYDLYVFENHRWRSDTGGGFIKNVMKKDVADAIQARSDASDDPEFRQAAKAAMRNVKTVSFRNNVVQDIAETNHDRFFLDKLDSKRHLVGWENGVYDLLAQEFRDGRPDDYVRLSTGLAYLPTSSPEYDEIRGEVDEFFRALHTDDVLRKYCLDTLAVAVSGTLSFEHLYCWTGTGSNGKSKCIVLIREAFGRYMVTLPPSILTGKRSEAGRPTPELASARGARLAVMPEMSAVETVNAAFMKELTGGDEISVRPLYGDPFSLLPQFSMILTCNDLSRVDATDDGTWRRLKVISHNSRFVTREPRAGESRADTNLDEKIKRWAPYFMAMLQERYPRAVVDLREEPKAITDAVNAYRATTDRDGDFAKQFLHEIEDGDDAEPVNAWSLLTFYKVTFHEPSLTLPKFQERLKRMGVPPVEYRGGQPIIPGYAFRPSSVAGGPTAGGRSKFSS